MKKFLKPVILVTIMLVACYAGWMLGKDLARKSLVTTTEEQPQGDGLWHAK